MTTQKTTVDNVNVQEKGEGFVWCSHEVKPDPLRNGPSTCTRQARRIVDGHPYCWQHAEMTLRPHMHWEQEERDLAQMRTQAPAPKVWYRWYVRSLYALRLTGWAERLNRGNFCTCSYCDTRATTSLLAVNPITLQRSKWAVCSSPECVQKLRAWEGAGNSRRSRAQMDWEYERGVQSPYDLTKGIPTQYPSLSRSTLRAFLESGLPAATVEGAGERTVAALNGSIRTLGFADQVYAEIRSGEAVLRRMEQAASA